MKQLALAFAVLGTLGACGSKKEERAYEPQQGSVVAPGSGSGSEVAGSGSAAPGPWDGKSPLTLKAGFATPESVLYDADADIYLVSNINGKPTEIDDNGFISKVSPEGKVIELKWIDGAKDNVKLDAPKGMTIAGGVLYVADVTVVRQFDVKTGAPKPDIKIPGATFVNDVAPAPDGGVYVTDSGLDASFKPTGSDAVYQIGKDGKLKPLIKNKELGAPNGVVAGDKGSVWVSTFATGQVYAVDAKGKQQKIEGGPPKGQLDGILVLEGGDLLVSSWEGSAVYRGKPGGEWRPVAEKVESPADIGWDSKRKRLLIPIFQGDAIVLHPLP